MRVFLSRIEVQSLASKNMKRFYVSIIFISGLFLVIYFLIQYFPEKQSNFSLTNIDAPVQKIGMYEMFYDKGNFSSAIESARDIKQEEGIIAVVVPHHLLASEYIAGMLARAKGRGIETVFIIGPNHFNVGTNIFSSAYAQWETALGFVQTNNQFVNKFLSDFDLKPNSQVFPKEHSVGAIVPFIKEYIPDAKIVPIVISSYATHSNAEELSQWLSSAITDKSLIIVSTDFSHYLDKNTADKNDIYTQELIEKKDTQKVTRLNNDYVDSPVSLATILLLAKDLDWGTDIIYNGNSFDFLIQKPVETTSYFGISFRSN